MATNVKYTRTFNISVLCREHLLYTNLHKICKTFQIEFVFGTILNISLTKVGTVTSDRLSKNFFGKGR